MKLNDFLLKYIASNMLFHEKQIGNVKRFLAEFSLTVSSATRYFP